MVGMSFRWQESGPGQVWANMLAIARRAFCSCAEPDGCFPSQPDPLHLVLRHPFLRPVMELPRARTHAPPSLARAHWP